MKQDDQELIAAAKLLRKEGWTLRRIAEHLGKGKNWVEYHLCPNHQNRAPGWGGRPEPRPISDEDLKRIKAGLPIDTRDLTGRLMGDPLPGRSALDRKREAGESI